MVHTHRGQRHLFKTKSSLPFISSKERRFKEAKYHSDCTILPPGQFTCPAHGTKETRPNVIFERGKSAQYGRRHVCFAVTGHSRNSLFSVSTSARKNSGELRVARSREMANSHHNERMTIASQVISLPTDKHMNKLHRPPQSVNP